MANGENGAVGRRVLVPAVRESLSRKDTAIILVHRTEVVTVLVKEKSIKFAIQSLVRMTCHPSEPFSVPASIALRTKANIARGFQCL